MGCESRLYNKTESYGVCDKAVAYGMRCFTIFLSIPINLNSADIS